MRKVDAENLLQAFPEEVPMVSTKTVRETIEHEAKDGEATWKPVTAFEAFGGDEIAWEGHGNPIAMYECSKCGSEPLLDGNEEYVLSDYCPFCGRRMRGV